MTSSQSIILLCFDYFQWFKPLHFYIVVTLFLATSKILERYSDANLERKSRYKNWRPPRLRAFGSGGRKRNTYEYACLLTRPDCCRNRKKVCQNLNEWIVIAIILIMYSSSTLIRSLVFLKLKKKLSQEYLTISRRTHDIEQPHLPKA